MSRLYDAIVLGVGGMGSAALYHIAQRGARVLGIERFDIPHSMGSSHGVTRIIRKAYFEHPSYVPLLHRAYALWRELEQTSGLHLLHITGSLDIGRAGMPVLDGSLTSCRTHKLEHELLSAAALRTRHPAFDVSTEFGAVYQPDGGFLLSEECISAYCMGALQLGAELRGRERVTEWKTGPDSITVNTDRGAYQTHKLIVTAGAWSAAFFPEFAKLLVPERQVLGWFQPIDPALFDPARFPVFIFNTPDGAVFYGFPVFGIPGFKIGRMHHLYEQTDADSVDRDVYPRDEELLRAFVRQYLPKANGPILSLKTCLFTNTPDEHFIIEPHPDNERIILACGFSGHGFKFASVVGEILSDFVVAGSTAHDVSLFSLSRFQDTSLHDASSDDSLQNKSSHHK